MSISRRLTLLGLLLLAITVLWWLDTGFTMTGSAIQITVGILPPAALAYVTYRRTRNWSGITALCMIPYAAMGMMDIVASSGNMLSGIALGIVAIATFFLVLDAGRREP